MSHASLKQITRDIGAQQFSYDDGRFAGYVAGSGAASVVIVHGVSGHSLDMVCLAEPLVAAGYRVYMPDLPGHGDAKPYLPSAFDGLGTWLHDFLQHVPSPVALIGHSFGGAVCHSYATQYGLPIGVHLFVCCPTPGISLKSEALRIASAIIPESLAQFLYTCAPAVWLRVHVLHRGDDRESLLLLIESEKSKTGHLDRIEINHLARLLVRDNPFMKRPLSARTLGATTVLYGERDNVIVGTTPAVIRQIYKGADIRELPRVGHILHFEAYREIAQCVLERIKP